MTAAIVQTCVDPRLAPELLRIQVRQRLERDRLQAQDIFVLGEVGGNVGSSFRNTVAMLYQSQVPIVLCAVLHHDDCRADMAGVRTPLATSQLTMTRILEDHQVHCPVLTGTIRTETNELVWSDLPPPQLEVTPFRMPRMFG
jgi:hypothetical protein